MATAAAPHENQQKVRRSVTESPLETFGFRIAAKMPDQDRLIYAVHAAFSKAITSARPSRRPRSYPFSSSRMSACQ